MASVSVVAQNSSNGHVNGKLFDKETLVFEGKLSKLKIGISVAELTFKSAMDPDGKRLSIETDAVSKGTLLRLLRYSFLQDYESIIDLDGFRILKTVKHDVQKERVRDSEAIFDYQEGHVTYVETDPKDKNRPPRRIASEIKAPLYDMVSAIYGVRLLPLAVGKRFDLSVSDSGLVYNVPIVVAARERVDTVLGKIWCFRLEPQLFGKDRFIERDGKMVVWVRDDELRTPVKATVNTNFGKVEIKLKSASKT